MADSDAAVHAQDNNTFWYKDAIIYQLHVRAFFDSDGNGIGDFEGLTSKLDYLQDLGVTAIWLLPFYPSPLKDDGYDIADYTAINPAYGNLRDVRQFIRAAHRRGLRIITELVCNHTSDQHPWFQRARQAKPVSSARNFYVWSDTPDKYLEARIIFKDFETSNWAWDPVASAYYWHRFYSHQPDLNFDNPQVRKAIFRAMDFWLEMGVDGLRLDAVPYLFEREGTNCENLPETHAFLRELRAHIDRNHANRMLLAEANQWPEDAVAYFGAGDECHMAFHFPVMPRMFMALRMEDRFPIIDILAQTPEIPDNSQWALFLRNHDELTLEMVTDEERDYMYQVYAHDPQARINLGIRRRLAPLLGNHRRKIELMNGLLFSLPGTPVIYYGDEIGMGDNIYLGDRNGVRTPMQWSGDRNAGFSRANPQRLYLPIIVDPEYHYEAINVETQQSNPHSLLWWMKRLITLRKRYKAFGRGTLEFLQPENRKVLAFVRRYRGDHILVIANLSRFVQNVELDLSEFRDLMPVELFGRVEFPPVSDQPYFITLGPHSFYWFSLEPQTVAGDWAFVTGPGVQLPTLTARSTWDTILQEKQRTALADVLPTYIRGRRWFSGKARRIKSAQIVEAIPVSHDGSTAYVSLVQVDYTEGDAQTYVLPLAFAAGERADALCQEYAHAVIARLQMIDKDMTGILYDPSVDAVFCKVLLSLIGGRKRLRGSQGELVMSTTRAFRSIMRGSQEPLEPSVVRAEQSNSSVIYGDRLILKLFRRLEPGINPDLEIGRFLTEKRAFAHTPPVAGAIEYRRRNGEPMTLGILQGFVPNDGDAWRYTLDTLSNFFEQALASQQEVPDGRPLSAEVLLEQAQDELPPLAYELIGAYLESARLLGQRTGEMHLALVADKSEPDFALEPYTSMYQRSVYQSMRSQASQVLQTLRKRIHKLPEEVQAEAQAIVEDEEKVRACFRKPLDHKISAMRSRYHGDYHLGQVLYTGKDFAIIDFEGEPARPLSERRMKRSALRDVAGMLRSFHYASYTTLQSTSASIRKEDYARAEQWAHFWNAWVSTAFLKGYLAAVQGAPFLPQSREELASMLDAYLLNKAIYELGYEMNNRPDWVKIPIEGIRQLLENATATKQV